MNDETKVSEPKDEELVELGAVSVETKGGVLGWKYDGGMGKKI